MELTFEGHFLDSDKEKAFAEMMCIVDCLHRIGDKIHQQDYAGALVHIDNFRRSVAELKRLNDRKKIYEQVRDLLNDMIEDGDPNG